MTAYSPLRKRVKYLDFIDYIQNDANSLIKSDDHPFPIQSIFEDFMRLMDVDCAVSFEYTFFELMKIESFTHKPSKKNQKILIEYFDHQNRLLSHIIPDTQTEQKVKLTGSSFAKIYVDQTPDMMYHCRKLYKIFNVSNYFLEIIQEAFVGYFLHSLFPLHVPKIYEIRRLERNSGKKKYVYFTQTFFQEGTYYANFDKYTLEEHIMILIQICQTLHKFQSLIHFIHADLKTNNICITRDPDTKDLCVHFIDFGYSSFVYQNRIIGADLDLAFGSFCKDMTFYEFSKEKQISHVANHSDPHKWSGDLFYLVYTILFYHAKFGTPLFAILHPLFDVEVDGHRINVFNELYKLHESSFDFIGFFMSKSSSMFTEYFGSAVDRDAFYERFLPEKMIQYLFDI